MDDSEGGCNEKRRRGVGKIEFLKQQKCLKMNQIWGYNVLGCRGKFCLILTLDCIIVQNE